MPSHAERAAASLAVHRRASPLKVRANWVVQQIKQREGRKSVAALAAANAARWRAINPEWAAYGPELVLTSRGTAARVVASQGQSRLGAVGTTTSHTAVPPGEYMIVWGGEQDANVVVTTEGPSPREFIYPKTLLYGTVAAVLLGAYWLGGRRRKR